MRWLIFLLCFLLIIVPAGAEVTGKYKVTYTDVTETTDTLQLDFADTISNATVTFTAKGGGSGTFDNSGGGSWQEYMSFPITTVPAEYAQYKIIINGTSWEIYSVDGVLQASGLNSNFWSLVKSDGSDIRVFNQNFKTRTNYSDYQLYFYIESFDVVSQTATIWVKIPANAQELNIAYGNSLATVSSYNDASKAFAFGSDFSSSLSADWQAIGTFDINEVVNGELHIKTTAGRVFIVGTKQLSGNFVVFSRIKLVNREIGVVEFMQDSNNFYITNFYYATSDGKWYKKIAKDVNGVFTDLSVNNVVALSYNTYYRLRITLNNGNIEYTLYSDDGTQIVQLFATDSTFMSGYFGLTMYGDSTRYSEAYIDYLLVAKLADPADFGGGSIKYFSVDNPRIILNGNTIQYNGSLNSSATLSIPASYFIQGTNNVTITSDNLAPMDVVIEFDYAFNVTSTTSDNVYLVWKNATVDIPSNTVSATFSQSFDLRTSEYRLYVLVDNSQASYSTSQSGNTLTVSVSLGTGTHQVDMRIAYKIADITVKDEEDLTQISSFVITVNNKNINPTNGVAKIFGDDVASSKELIKFSATDYNERSYLLDCNNLEQNLTLYLLKTLSGSQINFIVQESSSGAKIQNALVTAKKQINGIYEIVDQAYTDSTGTASLFLKPYDTYLIETSKENIQTITTEITITKTEYYVYIGRNTTIDWSKVNTNVVWSLSPRYIVIPLNNSTAQVNFSISSNDGSLEYATLRIKYSGSEIFNQTITNPAGGKIYANLTDELKNATAGFLIAEVEYKVNGEVFKTTRTIYLLGNNSGFFGTLKNFQLQGFARIIVAVFSTLFIVALISRVYVGFGTGIVALAILGFFTLAGWFDWWLFIASVMVVLLLYAIMR